MSHRPRPALTGPTPATAGGLPPAGQHLRPTRWLSVLASLLMIVTAVHGQAASKKRVAAAGSDGLKAPVQGLLDRHHAPKAGYTSDVRNFVVDTSWASLQPQQGGPIVHPNDIDKAITLARQQGMGLKLRVGAGIYAPEWAKHVGGDPVPFYYTAATSARAGELAGTVGHFWESEYGAAYQDLQNKLAALYDDVPEIRGVVVTRCQTIFSETYLRNTRDPRSISGLLKAGFTRSADDVCHNEQIVAHKVWQHTRSEVAFNAYQAIQPDGSVKSDRVYAESQMDFCRSTLGPRCILANYSISATRPTSPGYGEIYTHMAKLGAPLAFQTATAAKIGNWQATLDWAVKVSSSSVELPTGYDGWSASVLGEYADRLAANPIDAGASGGDSTGGDSTGGGTGAGTGGGGTGGTGGTGAGSGDAGLKAPVQGLLDRNHYPKAGFPGVVRNYVVTTSWASLQPAAGGPIVHPNDIDKAIAIAREQNMGLKLRVRAGIDAPEWAKRIGGQPVVFNYTSVTTKHAGQVAGTVGHFWLPEFGLAYADLQNKLAALYDDVPEIRGVVVSRCQTIFSETYLRNTRDPRAAHRLIAAGFTRAEDDVCHAEQIVAHRVWQRTRSEVAFNPYQAIQSDGSVKQDVAYIESQMDYCRAILGPRCVLANYSISAERPNGRAYEEIYAHAERLGAPIAFQTATFAKIGNWQQTLQWAVGSGASSVELPTGYDGWPTATLGRYAEGLAANPVT